MTDKEFLPEFLQRMHDLDYRLQRLGHHSASDCELYLIDLASWKLILSDQTPLIRVKAEMAQRLIPPLLADSITDVAREQGSALPGCAYTHPGLSSAWGATLPIRYFPGGQAG